MKKFIFLFLVSCSVFAQKKCFDAANEFVRKDYERGDINFDTIIKHIDLARVMITGCPMPEDTVLTITGEQKKISQYKGKVLIIDFWSVFCPPCVEAIPSYNALLKKYTGQLSILAVTQDLKKDMLEFLKKHSFDADIATETGIFHQRYSLGSGYPFTIILDTQGKIIHTETGRKAGKEAKLDVMNEFSPLIDKALKQK